MNGHYPAYPEALKSLMAAHHSNLYSIQLRPRVQDVNLRTANPLFSVNRTNDADGNPLSCFYTALWDSFQHLKIQPQDTRSRLIKAVLASTEAQHRDFKGIQRVLTSQTKVLLGIDIDFTHSNAGEEITEDFIHQDLGNSGTLFIRKQRPEDINQLSGNYLLIEPHQLIYIHRDGREEPKIMLNLFLDFAHPMYLRLSWNLTELGTYYFTHACSYGLVRPEKEVNSDKSNSKSSSKEEDQYDRLC